LGLLSAVACHHATSHPVQSSADDGGPAADGIVAIQLNLLLPDADPAVIEAWSR